MTHPRTTRIAFTGAVILLLAWGALAFGAPYPWAYWPLFAGAAALGLYGLATPLPATPPGTAVGTPLVIASLLVVIASLMQIVPLPVGVLERVSPASAEFLRGYSPVYAAGLARVHPISVDPQASWAGAAGLASLILLFLGLVRMLPVVGVRRVAAGMALLGAVVALVGIVQRPLFDGKIYGFWEPESPGTPFGPFVNRNHFAGWMLMALPVTMAFACACMERGAASGVRSGFRRRVLWLGSEEGSRGLLLSVAAVLMGLSVLLSLSRSGISCVAVSVMLITGVVLRRMRRERRLLVGYIAALIIVAVSWASLEAIALRFGAGSSGRLDPWRDAARISAMFMPFGSGLNTYGVTTLLYQTHNTSVHYLQAHNDYLELVAEGGLLVGVPAFFLLGISVAQARRRFVDAADDRVTWWLRVGAAAACFSLALQEMVDFSLQMPANGALLAVVAAIAVHRPQPPAGGRPSNHPWPD